MFRYKQQKNGKGCYNMRIAICDDEKNVRELIGKKVRKVYPKTELIFFESGEEILTFEDAIDILFLDIQMPRKNGMEIARELRKKEKNMLLIFVTALEEYVFQAFDVEAFHYLVKPIADKKFKEVLQKAVEQLSVRNKKENIPKENYVMISRKGLHTKVLLDTIVYAEVFNRKVVIHQLDSDIEYYGKMSELEQVAGEDFFRTHRAYLINFKYVEKYDASTVYLERGTVLMAKQKFPEFVRRYMKYNRRKGK